MRLDLGPGLAAVKAALILKVDAEAEQARQLFLTPGSGQALEYQATEAEARAYAAAGYPEPFDSGFYAFLEAERQAVLANAGVLPPANLVADEVIVQAEQWKVAGSAIKALRRGAKLAIDAATTRAAAIAAAQVAWPTI